MGQQQDLPPGADELQAYSLGKCDAQRAVEIEVFLAGGPDCGALLETAPEDALLGHLRGAGELPGADVPPRTAATLAWSARDSTPACDLGEDAVAFFDHPRYRLIRKLGQGGMGTVYLAEHRLMRRLVALKLIRAAHFGDPQHVARFRQEVEAAARLSHPYIVTAHDADEAAGTHFLVMEFVEGESLDRFAGRGPLPVHEACAYVRQAALGLQFAHEQSMVHRDVKPANLMRTADGTVKVLDFGLTRILREAEGSDGQLTSAGMVMGTADYLAPEQARDSHTIDPRADVYSLGCTLYHLLSGCVPFPGGTALDKIIRHATAAPEPLDRLRPEVPADLSRVVAKMMARTPAERHQSAAEVAEALGPFARSDRPAAATLAKPPSETLPQPVGPRRRLLAPALAVLLLVVGGIALFLAFRSRTDPGVPAGPLPEPEEKTAGAAATAPAKLELVRRIPVSPAVPPFYSVAISKGGKYAMLTWDTRPGLQLDLYDLASGANCFSLPVADAAFLGDGEEVVVLAHDRLWVREARSGKVLRESKQPLAAWGLVVAPGGRRLVANGPKGTYLYDLVEMKQLQFWDGKIGGRSTLLFSPDGERLLCHFEDEPWSAWDLEHNRPAGDCRGLAGVEDIAYFYPDGKTVAADYNGKEVRLDMHTGGVLGPVTAHGMPRGVVRTTYSMSWQRGGARYADGRFLVYRVPFTGKEFGRFRLPADDRAVPGDLRSAFDWEAFSEDDRYAAVLTTRSLYVLRLPEPPRRNSN